MKPLLRSASPPASQSEHGGESDLSSPAAIVLTATITPPKGMPESIRNDAKLRMAEYQNAFSHYLSVDDSLVDEIILLENSDADLSPFRAIAKASETRKTISLINTTSNYPPDKGKVYGEFLMLDNGVKEIDRDRKTKRFWKVTGRLIVLNIAEMIARSPSNYDVYCDMRDVPWIGDLLGGNRWMDLRFFSFTLPAYRKFFEGKYRTLKLFDESKEMFSYLLSEKVKGNIHLVPRFIDQPTFQGFSGTTNASYHGWKYRKKDQLRRMTRRFAPGLWI